MTDQDLRYEKPRPGFPFRQEVLGLLTIAAVGAFGYFAFPDDLAFLTRLISITFLVLSLDLVTGYCGVATLGQAALFGVSAYAVGNACIAGVTNPLILSIVATTSWAALSRTVSITPPSASAKQALLTTC